MYFATALFSLVAAAASVSAATVTFKTLDDTARTIYFTPNPGYESLDSVTTSGGGEKTVTFPDTWIGNYYAVKDGAENTPGMLGEVNFGGWNGMTYFDVSAIVDPSDTDNVKQLYPAGSETPISGCETFPCNTCYYLPDDVQTQVTDSTDLIQTLGSA